MQAYFASILFLLLFSALRFRVGCDWSGYYYHYLDSFNLTFRSALDLSEPGWWLIVRATTAADLPYPTLNIISSLLFFAGLHAIREPDHDPLGFLCLAFPVLIINMPMSAIRQATAMGILLIGVSRLMRGNSAQFVCASLIASTIHLVTIIGLLLILPTLRSRSPYVLLAKILLALAVIAAAFGSATGAMAERLERHGEGSTQAEGAVFRVAQLFAASAIWVGMGGSIEQGLGDIRRSIYRSASIAIVFLAVILPVSSVAADRIGYLLSPIQILIFCRTTAHPVAAFGQLCFFAICASLWLTLLVWTSLSSNFEVGYSNYDSWIFGFPITTQDGY